MKVAFLSTFYPFRGGIAQFNAALYRAFEKKHQVKAFNFSRQYPGILFPGKTQMVTPEDKADPVQADAVLDTINPITFVSSAKIIKSFAPDVLLTKFWMPFFAPSLGIVFSRLKSKSKTIAILDNVIPHERRPGDILLIKFFLNQNHGFVVMSEAVKNDLLSLKPDAKFIYHPHPLYNHFGERMDVAKAKSQLNIPDHKKVILFFGFIRHYKGLDILIRALSMLDESYVLVIAGEVYGKFDAYDELIRSLKLSHRVILHTRYIGDPEVSSFFSAADVCVLPYRTATQSGITSIAFHFEVPVIATNVGGLKECISDGKTGLVVDGKNDSDIAVAIRKFFETDMKTSSRPFLAETKMKLTWDNLAEEIEQFSNTL